MSQVKSRERLQRELSDATSTLVQLGDKIQRIQSDINDLPSDDTVVLQDALDDRQVVSFDYLAPGKFVQERRIVSIWEIEEDASGNARSILTYDHMRSAVRRFLVERITSSIALEPQFNYQS
jgi:predicted DNA-binding transcriptional regulator YafY